MTQPYISKAKRERLDRRMAELGLKEGDLVEKFVLGSGRGGQKVNKTCSCVYLRHVPSKIEVKCQRERLRGLNRYFARQELCERMEERVKGRESARRQRQERIRRQKRRRTRRQKERILADKKKQASKKKLRGPVDGDE